MVSLCWKNLVMKFWAEEEKWNHYTEVSIFELKR